MIDGNKLFISVRRWCGVRNS